MAPVRHAAVGQTGSFRTRGEGVSLIGFRNKNVKRRTWRPNHPQAFAGSVREGQGFAFRRKLKIQQNYKKLIWREKKAKTSRESQFTDRYPDHLKHLYLAEEERLRKQIRKADQSLLEQVDQPLSEEQVDQPLPEEQGSIDQAFSEEHCSIEQPHPEEQRSIRIKKRKRKHQIRKHRKSMSRYKLSVLLRDKNLRGENKREKKLKGSTKRRKWKCSKY
nr:thyroid transcription factor 1-associated protein 26 isoform X2 [Kogia breviceps]